MKTDRSSKKPHKLQAQEAAAAGKDKISVSKNDKKSKNQKRKKAGDSTTSSAADVVVAPTTSAQNKSQKISADSNASNSNQESSESSAKPAAAVIASDLEFSKMLLMNGEGAPAGADKNKGKPGSKVQRLKRLLEEAQYKREKLTAMGRSDDPEEQQAFKSVKWSDALKSAAGDKSLLVAGSGSGLDAEAKLKKAIKRREKAKQKSAEEWKERLDAVEETKTARINKREENLTARKNLKNGVLPEEKEKEGKEKSKNANNNINNTKSNNVHTKAAEGGEKGKGRAGFEGKKKEGDFLNRSRK